MRLASLAVLGFVSLAAAACGNAPTGFDADYGVYGAGSGGKQPSASVFTGGPGADAGLLPSTQGAACRTGTAQAESVPLYLVLLLDRSGSMCEYVPSNRNIRDCGNTDSKWQQMRAALYGFFTSPQSKGINVSLVAFPYADQGDICGSNHYVTPSAAAIQLPDLQNTLMAAVDSNPSTGGGQTPTLSALTGGIQVAGNIKSYLGSGLGKVAVLMATDGLPEGQCNDSGNIQASANLAASVSGAVPTYVLGVGGELGALNTLAQAGATGNAFIATTGNPASVGQQVTDALNKIRTAALGCEYAVPAAPQGKTLDPAAVNVEYTSGTGHATVPYTKDCASGVGWQYDNAAAPKSIRFCASTCGQVSADPSAKIDIVFGCETVGDKVR